MLSDCGTNFVGAERELKKRFAEWNNECALEMRKKAIVWSFNPPAAPHAGGLWERMVRSTKRILKSIVDSRVPSDQVFITLVVVAEGIINQRPLTRVSNDPNDLRAITPAMIVSPGTPASSSSDVLPPSPFSEASLHRIHDQSRDLCDSFWRRWSRDYLSTLQTRQKWFNPQRNFVIGDLVLMTSELHPRDSWPLATVVNTYPDSNGQIRRLRVRTRDREFERDCNKIVLLEAADSLSSLDENGGDDDNDDDVDNNDQQDNNAINTLLPALSSGVEVVNGEGVNSLSLSKSHPPDQISSTREDGADGSNSISTPDSLASETELSSLSKEGVENAEPSSDSVPAASLTKVGNLSSADENNSGGKTAEFPAPENSISADSQSDSIPNDKSLSEKERKARTSQKSHQSQSDPSLRRSARLLKKMFSD